LTKKSPTRKRSAKSSRPKTKAKTTRRTSTKRRPTKSSSAKATEDKAAKRKVAARAAATRKRKPAKPKSTLATAASFARGAAETVIAAVTQRLPWSKDENDPITLLETDHRRFEKLLKEGEDSTERAKKGRAELLETLVSELNVHEAIEEQVLYPALEPHAEARHIVLEGFEEHHIADVILKELTAVATDDEKWGAKFKVLKENITHHIQEEERAMFPAARGTLAREELLALGARMRALKAELER
jgi:hemerythrin-like domain-containing protein